MLFDYHVHTEFSGDCSVPMEEIVLAAIQDGLKEICFTDHLDYDSTEGSDDFTFSSAIYKEAIEQLKEKYSHEITIKMGVEIGLQPHVLEKNSAFLASENFDFALASMHCCERMDFYLGDFFNAYDSLGAIEHYYDELFKMITCYQDYSVLGHLDIYKRYNPESLKIPFSRYDHLVEKVLKCAIKDEKGIEINTSGLRGDLREGLPSWEIVEMYKELGGRIITLGSDSHGSETLCANFEEVLRGLTDRGFKDIYRFDRMKPIEVSINSLL